jgi:hypothetical protein
MLQVSRVVPSFLVTYELASLLAYLAAVAPSGPLWRGDSLTMMCCFAAMFAAHYAASTSDPGHVPLPGELGAGAEEAEGAEQGKPRPLQLDVCATCKVAGWRWQLACTAPA